MTVVAFIIGALSGMTIMGILSSKAYDKGYEDGKRNDI